MDLLHLDASPLEGNVLHIALNRPPANAVNQNMYKEIRAAFTQPDALLPNVRAIILSGNGKHFCAGNDLDEFATMTPENGVERMWRVREAFFAIQDCVVPVIAAVHGAALGTGLCLAAACDFAVAGRSARFGLPELTVGVFGGARHLARIAPQPLVRRMFFTGEHLPAEEFAAAGGAVFVCDDDRLLDEAKRHAARIAAFSPTAVRIGKQVLNRIEEMDIKAGYAYEQGFTVAASGHPDAKEALAAFGDKRDPVYRDRTAEWTITLE